MRVVDTWAGACKVCAIDIVQWGHEIQHNCNCLLWILDLVTYDPKEGQLMSATTTQEYTCLPSTDSCRFTVLHSKQKPT